MNEEEMENYELKEFDSSGEWVSIHTEKDWHSNNGVYCLEKKQDSVLIEQRRNKMDFYDYISGLKEIMTENKLKLIFEVNAKSIAVDLCRKNTEPACLGDPCEDEPINTWVCDWQHYKDIDNLPAKIENYIKAYDALQRNKD